MVVDHVVSTGKRISKFDCVVNLIVLFLNSDIAKGNILSLIESNVALNAHWISGHVDVVELDFYNKNYSESLTGQLEKASVVVAADGNFPANNLFEFYFE